MVQVLRAFRFHYSSEEDLQRGVEEALKRNEIPYVPEHRLGDAGRIDFFVDGWIGIEIKVKGTPAEVGAQIVRYCAHSDIRALILVTGKTSLGRLPKELMGKEVHSVALWESFL